LQTAEDCSHDVRRQKTCMTRPAAILDVSWPEEDISSVSRFRLLISPARSSDTTDTVRFPLHDTFKHASIRKRLWLGAAGVAVFIGTLAVALAIKPPDPNDRGKVGLDFIAFYTAGRFVREGRSNDLYDIHKVQIFQHELARQNGVDLGSAVGPWWNPPFYAWTFVPLARLGYREAIEVWMLFNVACAAIAAAALCLLVAKFRDWRSSLLVPVLMALSVPFIHALSHGQNTCTSLLLVTIAVVFWRKGWAIAAGMVMGLMFYKPQLAAVLSVVLVLSLGARALAGLSIAGLVLLFASLALPGSIHNFLHQMPWNLHFVQCEVPYLWDRHVTFKAFWRLLIQGSAAGEPDFSVTLLAGICQASVAAGLLWAAWRVMAGSALADASRFAPRVSTTRPPRRTLRGLCPAFGHSSFGSDSGIRVFGIRAFARDRLIAAAIAATPLLMPFYFDYDQLLLAIPAVLFAAEISRRDPDVPLAWADRWLLRIWPVQYAWLLLNSDIADVTRINFGVPLLAAVGGLLIVRAGARPREIAATTSRRFTPSISSMLNLADMDTDAAILANQLVALASAGPSDPAAVVEDRHRVFLRAGDRDRLRRPRESA